MFKELYTALAVPLILTPLALAPVVVAKPKPDASLPVYILKAHTVAVIVDPQAGVSLSDPNANQVAQKDVETALLKWGRFEPVISTRADLIIVIRRGNGKLADETVSDPRQNNRAGVINPTDDGISVGAQHGPPPKVSSGSPSTVPYGSAHPQAEAGNVEDSFVVYDGDAENPIDSVAGWRYVAKNGLHPHDVPAVDEFRKAIAEAEKAAAKQQSKTPPASQPAQPQSAPPAPQPHP
jgi:hypothetical protein